MSLLFLGDKKPFSDIPGPKPTFLIGNVGDFIGKLPWDVCAQYGREYGGITRIWLGGTPTLVLNDPELIAQALDPSTGDFYKDAPGKAVKPLLTSASVFILNAEAWKTARAAAPFSASWYDTWLDSRVGVVRDYIGSRADELAGSTTQDLYQTMQSLIFDVFSVATLGHPLDKSLHKTFKTMADTGSSRINSKIPLLASPPNPCFHLARRKWFATFNAQVRALSEKDDGNLVNAMLQGGTGLDAQGMAVSLANLYFTGAFSTSSGTTSTLLSLSQHADAADAVQSEIGSMGDAFDAAALATCHNIDWNIRESIRLNAPVSVWGRNVAKDHAIEFAGHQIPANTNVMITNCFLHQDPAHWKDAQTYQPQRWADEGMQANPIGSGHFFPFGRGSRMCMGLPLALFSMKMAVATLLSKLKVEVTSGAEFKQDFYFGVMLPRGIEAKFSKK